MGLVQRSSKRMFELTKVPYIEGFYEKVLVKVQREYKNGSSCCKFELVGVRVVASLSYWGFELSGLYFTTEIKVQRLHNL